MDLFVSIFLGFFAFAFVYLFVMISLVVKDERDKPFDARQNSHKGGSPFGGHGATRPYSPPKMVTPISH